jgi:NTE family protein
VCLKNLALVLLYVTARAVGAATQPAPAPRLVLVLSGGGARGAAHVGVLKVLEELHVVPDMVVGTSMGSIVGGLYAAGWSPDDIEKLLESVDWNAVFSDTITRADRSFRRKQDDRPQMIPAKLRFRKFKPYLPPGVLGGQNLELFLRSLEIQSSGERDFDRLPIRYRAVATDIATGEVVVIGRGSLATAMRASMSIPGALPPVELDGRRLVDGGASANLPVGIAQELGATHIIAIDISSPLKPAGEELNDFISVLDRLYNIMTVSNRVIDSGRLRGGDVLIRPELGDISFVDFQRTAEAVGVGEKAAREKGDILRTYAGDEAAWVAFVAGRHPRPLAGALIDRIRLENSSPVADELIRRVLALAPGQSADDATLRPALLRLFSLDYLGLIKDRLETLPDGSRELVITTPPPRYGRNRLQLGISLAGDFQGDSQYAIVLRHQLLAANQRGGEWQNGLQFGEAGVLESGFYQPLDYGMRWFVHPQAGLYRETQRLWADGRAVAEYRMSRAVVRLDAGRVLGSWGELRVGAYFSGYRGENRLGASVFPDLSEHRAAAEASFRIDSLSSRAFPRDGADLKLRYTRSTRALGSDSDFEQVHGRGSFALTAGENTLRPELEYGDSRGDAGSVFSLFQLGGLSHLAGLGASELLGEKVAFAQLAGYRRLKKLDLGGLHVRVFAGVSVEAGNVYGHHDPITGSSLRTGWSAFLGADTPIGPAYIAYGDTGGRSRVYVTIGDRY